MKILFVIAITLMIIFRPSPPVEVETVLSAAMHDTAFSAPLGGEVKIATEEAKVKIAGVEWDAFVEKAPPIAAKYDIPLKVMMSQAALETGHGTSWQAKHKNNYFGLGAYNDNTSFGYASVEECIEYYAMLIAKDKRYSKAYQARNNPEQMIVEIKKAGYASDPLYVEKIMSLAVWNNY